MCDIEFKKIQDICMNHYNKCLPKSGKSKTKIEWTVLTAIVMDIYSDYRVVSFGTGTKCIGQNLMCPRGLVVNDSHAEVVTRRSFLCFLYEEIEKSFNKSSSVFNFIDGKCELKPGIRFHFFTTHAPCGDASIIEKDTPCGNNVDNFSDNIGNPIHSSAKRNKRHNEDESSTTKNKILKTDVDEPINAFDSVNETDEQTLLKSKISDNNNETLESNQNEKLMDIHRTGAKCLLGEDPLQAGVDYHALGVLRTKPGRGDRTLSLSCSDKICRWNVLGLQGALIMHFLKAPIYFDSFVIASEVFCEKAFNRATREKISNMSPHLEGFKSNQPQLFHSQECLFENRKMPNAEQIPCASSICWFASDKTNNHEVINRGKILGLTKKCKNADKSCFISKASLFKKFLHLKEIYLKLCPKSLLNDSSLKTYFDHKMASLEYQEMWKYLKEHQLNGWISSNESFNKFQ